MNLNVRNHITKCSSTPIQLCLNLFALVIQDRHAKLSPRITDVKTYDDKVVKVLFADGTYEKAVLSENDTFSLEQGVSICLTKKLLSKIVGSDFSGSVYNKIVDYALGVYDDKVKAAKETKEKAEKEKAAAKEKAEKIKAIRAKRKAQLREEQIEIQAEAYRRAMQKD